jgi:hypothetical protein
MKQHYLPGLITLLAVLTGTHALAQEKSAVLVKPAFEKTSKQGKPWLRVTQKHNGSGVQLRYRILGEPRVGQALRVQIELASTGEALASMRVDKSLSLNAGAAWQKGSAGLDMPLTKPGKTYQTVTVTPDSEGLHFIYLTTTQDSKTSVSSIAIKVGDAPIATPTIGEKVTTPSGEKIISMPSK